MSMRSSHPDHQDMKHSHHDHQEPKSEVSVIEDRELKKVHEHRNGQHGSHRADHRGHEVMFRNRFWLSLFLSIPVLLYSENIQRWLNFTMVEFSGSQWVTPVLSIVIFIIGGVPFIRMAVPELRNRMPGMMTLITLAISVSFGYSLAALFFNLGEGFFWELVTLIDVMLLGHWIEMRSVRQASGALDELAKLMPDIAERLLPDSKTEIVRVPDLLVGDLLLIRPGASIPADGIVEEGESDVDEAMITGESLPVKKARGSRLVAGTINSDGSLRMLVSAIGDETALAGIMRLVAEAQESKSRTQVLADKAAAWLFYIAIAVATLTGVVWGLSIGMGLYTLQRIVTVLVIACPHALGLAVPLVVAISTSSAAKNGILVRDRLALEAAREIDVVVFDKTGTLTEGRQGIVGMEAALKWDPSEVLALAAAVEGDSEHVIARAIREHAERHTLNIPRINDFEAIKGRGVKGIVDGREVFVGGPRLLEMLEIELPDNISAFSISAGRQGQSVVYLVVEGKIAGSFALADVIRTESQKAVSDLKGFGIEVAMITGDSQAVAENVADQLSINKFIAEVLPEHKGDQIAKLQQGGKRVAMVGDGVNDAPALARADVGIAIGSGTDVAVESAGIILVNNNPRDVVKVIKLSRESFRKMIQNLAWASGYNIFALPLAAGVMAGAGILLSPAIGALFMSLSTVIVAINAQLLRRVKL